ncbi:MAG TPA: hypothetical protein VH331_05065 [Allosphingosinicella sp.]|jgi:hypothetical protein|nr:hypothetical protein [Allosphingosinicella sp.]
MHMHLPKPLHGWREFAGEVGIIVIGVLIALGADQAVETWQMHEKIGRAEAAMRLELAEDDGVQAYGRVLIGGCLDAQLVAIHDGAGKVPADRLRQWVGAYNPPFRSWDTEAWKAVLGSDVASHMGAERLVQWSSPYRVLVGMTESNVRERDVATDLHEALPPSGEPSEANLQELRRSAARLRMSNTNLYRGSQLLLKRSEQLGAAVPDAERHALLKEARAIYGNCAQAPRPNTVPIAQSLRANLQPAPSSFGS